MPLRRALAEQLWSLPLRELPNHPAISVGRVQISAAADAADEADAEPLIRVKRPVLTPAPRPPEQILDYVERGWEDPEGRVAVQESRNVLRNGEPVSQRFDADPARVAALRIWQARWNAWAEGERPARQAMRTFESFYELKGRIDRESESVELILGDGRLRWLLTEGRVDHPVLLQRVELEFDPEVPEFRVVDADRPAELYGALLQGSGSIPPDQLNRLRLELEHGGYHPLAQAETSGYLRRLAQLLGPRGTFRKEFADVVAGADPIVMRDPVLFLRTRASGFPAAFDRVLEDLEERKMLPISLTQLVGVEPPPPAPEPLRDHSPWSEPPDVLLSKPANAEQVEIARALARHRAVLVQGPPGTGKSHTIANLIGHLVAQGKRVLVTSHTTKALRVLRGHVVETLRPLCVAVLENDLEGRTQMEEAVRGILSRLTTASDEQLSREVVTLDETRGGLNREIEKLTVDLRTVREDEYQAIVVNGEGVAPADAARWVRRHTDGNDWVPGPVEQGAPLPLAPEDLRDLYLTSSQLTAEEEREIEGSLPELDAIPSPVEFAGWVQALGAAERPDSAPFWDRPATEGEITALETLRDAVGKLAQELAQLEPWQRAVVAAGHGGGAGQKLWTEIGELISSATARWEHTRSLLMENEVQLDAKESPETVGRVSKEIITHLESGKSLGFLRLRISPVWNRVVRAVRVNKRSPKATVHFRATVAHLELLASREKLATRWTRQAEPIGLPSFRRLGAVPEPVLRDYAAQFDRLLRWWEARWRLIEVLIASAGLRWQLLRDREIARAEPTVPFERDAAMVGAVVGSVVQERLGLARVHEAEQRLQALDARLVRHTGPCCRALRESVVSRDAGAFETRHFELHRVAGKQAVFARRCALLERLEKAAPDWALAIRTRKTGHDGGSLPGDPVLAWRWRQLRQEIDRRAALDEIQLTEQLRRHRDALREVTVQLIDRRAWLGQLRRTNLSARQALQGWATTQRKIGKGTGKRVPQLQARARDLLMEARAAVPVWIMPLSRVAESFDPSAGRFDVVIVDEASQSDVTGLLAWYLGDSIAVVGDHEQVSPMDVGQEVGPMQGLIDQFLDGIPNRHLYDGTTSIYDLARMCFGGTIALREHFRCVPDIIEFSNQLSYNNEIRPLRNPAAAPKPHVVELRIADSRLIPGREGKTNIAEARMIAALIKATVESPANASRTIGAITLLGDEQAGCIQDLAVGLVGAVDLERHRFAAGSARQFQGDERDVIFLSMVDVPADGPLPMRQTPAFKQRYNVAASRARDQLWLVHSLDPRRDLKAGDLRRTLIEHVQDPGAKRRAMAVATRRAESPLERAVIERLVAAGYAVEPQVWVGAYRIDMVVSCGDNQVALECDGDRFHGLDEIPQDMARQAVLERAGWRFIRVRGTRFFRAPETTMVWVFDELARLGIEPTGDATPSVTANGEAQAARDAIVRRAWEIMREQRWLPDEAVVAPPPVA